MVFVGVVAFIIVEHFTLINNYNFYNYFFSGVNKSEKAVSEK